ncbi:BON domain-containing protein [Paraburkholderia domus]|uniref:BON domain-containing protein n=1 Tax=Paraburkholderia domus TaxID=2793075 RepID=A0A9N8N8G8_9BURK|nr:BON domain-containing protein [Paraburkholderia domus]MBK5053741.1 BON domain-containing protein [Burkholderia sp. R-70006]MBK5122245.1 BON domain-containing protein [Burkholderia sp. R-69980]MBK5169776.1 BON domain-containing protein [Burkholderia sp. R-70211]MBK5185249.1 BON domain-containing protein [Burkholderia sp. R-69749]CAE6843751.1 hypothetical protein R70006_07233 [Paraburkholderia domus]
MKSGRAVPYIGGALVALTAFSVYAQNGEVSASPPVAASPSAKAIKAADRQLQKKVRGVLSRTKGLGVSGISVKARSGMVTLQGWVPDESQVALATQAAQGVSGVTSVKNDLTVRPAGQ